VVSCKSHFVKRPEFLFGYLILVDFNELQTLANPVKPKAVILGKFTYAIVNKFYTLFHKVTGRGLGTSDL
jgi:hypothetical protein